MKTNSTIQLLKTIFVSFLLITTCTFSFSQTRTRVTGAANWNSNSTWVKPLTGSVTCLLISKIVTGSGTLFTTELSPGDVLTTVDGQQIGTVFSISNNTSLTLVSNASILLTLFTNYGVEKVPGAADDVEIGNTLLGSAVTVTMNAPSATVNSLTFITDVMSNVLTHSGTNSLTVNNQVTINQPTANSRTVAWNINGGTATVNGAISFAGANVTASRIGTIVITSGTLNANGGISFSGATAATKVIDMSGGAGRINLKGSLTVPASSATLTAGTSGSIFNYADNVAQTINYFPAGKYDNLYVNNTNASGATLSAAITTANVAGDIAVGDMNSGSLLSTNNLAVTLSNSRSVTIASGSTLDAMSSLISFGTGSPNLSIDGTFKTAQANGFSGATNTSINSTNAPTFLLGANSMIEYNSNTNQVVSARTDYANLLVSGGALKTANGQITTNSSLAIGSATTFDAGSYMHYVKGTLSSSGTFISNTSTMNFAGSGAQTIPAVTYNGLATSNAGTKTVGGALTISGNLVIGSGTNFDAVSYSHNITGDFTNSGTFTASSSTINFNGTSDQSITGATSFNNLSVNNANAVKIQTAVTTTGLLNLNNGKIDLNGNSLIIDGTFSGNATNSIKGSATSDLTIGSNFSNAGTALYFDQAAATNNNYLKYFTVNKTVSLGNPLNIAAAASAGTVLVSGGATLATNDYMTLKSVPTGGSRIDVLPVDGSGDATAFITGKVNMERYIPLGKGWHLLSAPVKASGSPTINEAWQEGLTTASPNPNLYPGYGVKICGGTTANGFDASNTNSSFIKTYNPTTNTLAPLPAVPGTNIPISSYPGYFLYIRGDRSVDMMQGTAAAITATTLRLKGQVITGKQTISIGATNYTLLGNPYPSAIDFHTLFKNNVNDIMYVWDPLLAGTYGLGGYVTLSWNNTSSSYDITAAVSDITQYIPSGEAVLISSADNINPGSVVINEADKVDNSSARPSNSATVSQKLKVNLRLANTDGNSSLLDGVVTTYANANSNIVDQFDAKKLNSSNQNIGIKRNGSMLAIERRKTITTKDTCFLSIYQMKIQSYMLEVIPENMDTRGMSAWLKDSYSATTDNTPINLHEPTYIPFSINTDPASYAQNRFSIVFKPANVPVKSKFAKLNIQQESNDQAMVIYPNPVKGKTANIKFNDIKPGSYQLQLFNTAGQIVLVKDIHTTTAFSTETIEMKELLQPGKYLLKLAGADSNIHCDLIKQ